MRLRALDAYCGAGGTGMGLSYARFDVDGVDTKLRRRYPFTFHQGDAIEFIKAHGHEYHLIVAGPPCMRYSRQTKLHGRAVVESHPDLVAETRDALVAVGTPWIFENVEGAPLVDPLLLCGSMFGQERLRRHRLFESSDDLTLVAPGPCRHEIQRDVVSVTGHSGGTSARDGDERFGDKALWSDLMGIDWMSIRELALAVPPYYSRWLGLQAVSQLAVAP